MKTIEIRTQDKCDYCDEPMLYAGADPNIKKVRRACGDHVGTASVQLKADEWETNIPAFVDDRLILKSPIV